MKLMQTNLIKTIKPFILSAGLVLTLAGHSFSASAQQLPFAQWLDELRSEASQLGISDATLNEALAVVEEPLPRVIELDKSQPEYVQTFSGYMNNRMSQARIERGQALLLEHADLFARIQRTYGVQPQYLVSFWALESNFGDYTGGFSGINALATLAYDPRRSGFFRNELLTALKIIDEGHISVERMTSSWAGAMGQCQFMPSTFSNYAVDGDGDGRIDIWDSLPDIFASAANYLSSVGWRGDERWGREVILPDNFDYTQAGPEVRKTVTQWNRLGVSRVNGNTLGNSDDMQGSILLPAGANGPAFLGYNNFRTTRKWNRPVFYAISVGHLADRFAGGGPIEHMPSDQERALSSDEVMELQTILNAMDIDAGTPDGRIGPQTRLAVRTYQEQSGLPTDSYASYDLLTILRVVSLSE